MDASRYSSGSKWVRRGLTVLDGVLARLLRRPRLEQPIPEPRRILVANTGHLGDVILSTAVLPVLRRAFPHCHIGFLLGSWSKPLLQNHPLVDALHVFDPIRVNRSRASWWQKLLRHDRSRRQALREIADAPYDLAIDLRYYFGNAIPLLWQAQIPTRIGYTGGGFGPMLTHCLPWQVQDCHVLDYFADLLRLLPMRPECLAALRPTLGDDAAPLPTALTSALTHPRASFLLFHPGSGAECKEWPIEHWQRLAQRALAAGHVIVLTGQGARERICCERIAATSPRVVHLCDRLNWQEYVATVRHARLVVGVDSLAGHVAAAVQTPCVIVGNGINHPSHWRPFGNAVRVLRHPVACMPCYRTNGCETMDCVRRVEPNAVWNAVSTLLDAAHSQSA